MAKLIILLYIKESVLTDKELDIIIKDTILKIKNRKDISKTLNTIYSSIRKFVPYDSIHILSVDADKNIATTMELEGNKPLTFSLDVPSVLSQCYESHHPMLINDIERSLLYNKNSNDYLYQQSDKTIVKVLAIPILGDDTSKNMLGILWIGISKGIQQFIQEDIDHLVRFTNATKSYIFAEGDPKSEKDNALLACQASKNLLQEELKRHEDYFSSTIHDIRTPMNAVVGFMELMMLSETDKLKRDYIDSTLKSSEHIINLINDALDMTKISSGKMSLEKSQFSPLDGLSDIAKLFYNSRME